MTFHLRPARSEDLEGLLRLTTLPSARGFLTLPSESKEMKELIALSQRSFTGKLEDKDEGEYLFVLFDGDQKKVAGCSLIIARHGTPETPHNYFEVTEVQKASRKLKKVFKHQILRLRLDAEGRTELGGLILDPGYRGHPQKLGKTLSFARLLYIDRNPRRFQERLLVELLPPLTPEGKSLLWESLGRKFTGLDYLEADRLSRNDKEFITSLFPDGDFYTLFLPEEARFLIGEVGSDTKPVARMLSEVGFHYLGQIDPFDGGPHYGALQKEVKINLVQDFLKQAWVEVEWGG
ncbi:MAG: arginine N-succinyltransferase [Deltaproteobacteria bacterium]|nr:arginine N-succinyltransferase [Deltaproteobacteria bacterium]